MKKKIIIGLIILVLIIGGFSLFGNGDESQNYETVEERELVKEVFESGAFKSGEDIALSFQVNGKLQSVPVKEGDQVEKGDLLARLDRTDLLLQKEQAQKELEKAFLSLKITFEGAAPNQINSLQSRLSESETSVENARQSLEEAKKAKEASLESVYKSVPALLSNSHTLAKNLSDTFVGFREDYFSGFYNQDTYRARTAISVIEDSYEDLQTYYDIDIDSDYDQIEEKLKKSRDSFSKINQAVNTVVNVFETDFYEKRISLTDEQTLYSSKEEASTNLTGIANKISQIESAKSSTNSQVISAQSNLDSALSRKNEVEDNLDLSQNTRTEEERIALANFQSAQAGFSLAQNSLDRATLTAPVSGIVKRINYEQGETVAPNSPAVVITPKSDNFYVDLNIYEGDIANVKVGDKAEISFIAFDQTVQGEVISRKNTGQLIDGVVYYQVKVNVNNPPEGILNEMTADVSIKTETKNTLAISRQAVQEKDGKNVVMLIEDGELVEKEVETGMVDSYGFIEVKSGLSAGDQVLID